MLAERATHSLGQKPFGDLLTVGQYLSPVRVSIIPQQTPLPSEPPSDSQVTVGEGSSGS